jgi:hypothetical protein
MVTTVPDSLNKLYIEVTSFLTAHTQPEYPATYRWVQTANVFVGMDFEDMSSIGKCTRKYERVYAIIKPVEDEIDLDVVEAYFVQKEQQARAALHDKAKLKAMSCAVNMGVLSHEEFRDLCGLL